MDDKVKVKVTAGRSEASQLRVSEENEASAPRVKLCEARVTFVHDYDFFWWKNNTLS